MARQSFWLPGHSQQFIHIAVVTTRGMLSTAQATQTPPMKHASKSSCCLCQRQVALTFHHLIPKKVHRRKRFQKAYTREQLNVGIHICRRCHNGIHRLYDEMTLAQQYNTLQALQEDPAIQRHVQWVAKQKERLQQKPD